MQSKAPSSASTFSPYEKFVVAVLAFLQFTIIADLFPLAVRGRVMGTVQTAFAASQVLGLPFALYLSNHWGSQAPFVMVFAVSAAVGVVIAVELKTIDAHLKVRLERNPFGHLLKTVRQWRYLRTGVVAFVAGPLLGRLADRVGKYRVFCVGSALAAAVVAIYCNLGVTPLRLVV